MAFSVFSYLIFVFWVLCFLSLCVCLGLGVGGKYRNKGICSQRRVGNREILKMATK